jgi:hypothetical protein
MWTRRDVLLAGTVLGAGASAAPLVAALPRPATLRRADLLRVGLLQSVVPFIDPLDLPGSRARAFAALRLLLERSLEQYGDLDWLAAGAFALGHAQVTTPASLPALALEPHSDEIRALRLLASRHGVQLSLGAAWRMRGGAIAPHLLLVDRDGALQTQRLRPGPSAAGMAVACARRGLPGAWIAPARDPALPPPLRSIVGGDTVLLDAASTVIAAAATQAETCVVGDLALSLPQR